MVNHPYFTPNSPLQQQGLTALRTDNQSLLVTWPYGAGKTWLAEVAIADTLNKGLRAIYVTPADIDTIADQHSRWTRLFPGRCIGLYADIYDPQRHLYPRPIRQTDIFVVSPIHVAGLLLSLPPDMLSQLGCVIIDDLHLMQSGRVPPLIDLALTYLRLHGPTIRLLTLAEGLAHPNTIAGWLDAQRLLPDAPLTTAVPGMLRQNGGLKRIPASGLADPQALSQAIATLMAYDPIIDHSSIVHVFNETLAAYEGYLPDVGELLSLLNAVGLIDHIGSGTTGLSGIVLSSPLSRAIGRHALDVGMVYRLNRILQQYPSLSWLDMLIIAGINTPIDLVGLPEVNLAYLSSRLVGLHSTLLTCTINQLVLTLDVPQYKLFHAIRLALFNYDRLQGVSVQTCAERYGISASLQLDIIAMTRRLVGAMEELSRPTAKVPPTLSTILTAILSSLLNGLPMGAIPLFRLPLSIAEIRKLHKAGFSTLTCLAESEPHHIQPLLGSSSKACSVIDEAISLLAKHPETYYTASGYSARFPLVLQSAPVLRSLSERLLTPYR